MTIPFAVALTQWCLVACADGNRPMPLTQDGKAVCRIVVVAEDPAARLMAMAVRSIADPVKRWSGVELPVVRIGRDATADEAKGVWGSPAIVLATLADLHRIAPQVISARDLLIRMDFADEHGYACLPVESQGTRLLLVIGQTTRAVYNGAVYVSEFGIDGPPERLLVDMNEAVRMPRLRKRPVYALSIWGEEDEYTAEDWMKVFDAFARDGVTDVYFWLSGHFRSDRFPQTFRLKDGEWDSTEKTRIGALEDQRRLIRRTHELGIRFFLGGGLGAWCGTYMLTNREAGTMRTGSSDESGKDVSDWALCPANDRSREALIAYYREMFDLLPEADGLYIESADEYGECACDRCRRPADDFGSRMFGQYQLSLVQRLMHEIWTNHPHARLCYTIGYAPHKQDPAYYEVVRQMSTDARIEWMEARDSWTFPGPRGEALPPAYFSPQVLRWDYCDTKPLENLVERTWRAATSGMTGYIATFSPGFSSGSFYHDVPYPTGQLPYILTQFVYREAAWQPTPDVGQMKERIGRRFFGHDVSQRLTDQLWSLREILRTTAGKKIRPEQMQALADMEGAVRDARREATPKRREGLDLMTRAIDDIRRVCKVVTTRPR